jgi:hypothetical protein
VVKQRLKQMVIGTVDQEYVRGCLSERFGGCQSREAPADDDDSRFCHLFLDVEFSAAHFFGLCRDFLRSRSRLIHPRIYAPQFFSSIVSSSHSSRTLAAALSTESKSSKSNTNLAPFPNPVRFLNGVRNLLFPWLSCEQQIPHPQTTRVRDDKRAFSAACYATEFSGLLIYN